jgi:hypothetical protein
VKGGSIKQWAAVCLIVVASLLSGYYSFFIHPARELIRDDGAAKWEERMQPVREALPPSVREVGYVADPEQTAQVQEYSLTRYALAPVVVRPGVAYEWIVGNFTQPGFEDLLKEKITTAYTIRKFGAGIYLIHRKLQ